VIRVAVVDDQSLVRAGFRMILAAQPDMTIVGEAGDGAEALRLLTGTGRVVADVVVMDIRMPVMDGVEATRRLCGDAGGGSAGGGSAGGGSAGGGSASGGSASGGSASGDGKSGGERGPRVLVLTTFDTDADAFAALQAGASGFLLKNVPPEELLSAIRVVAGGDAVVAPRITRRLLDRFAGQLAPAQGGDRRLDQLTERERAVLLLVAQGLSNAEIAQRLVIAETTVKTHVGRILTKLDLRDRVQAVVLAYESGLVRPSP
jgi:DNA-binding NarL/FixJ family response regulator